MKLNKPNKTMLRSLQQIVKLTKLTHSLLHDDDSILTFEATIKHLTELPTSVLIKGIITYPIPESDSEKIDFLKCMYTAVELEHIYNPH